MNERLIRRGLNVLVDKVAPWFSIYTSYNVLRWDASARSVTHVVKIR